MTEPTINNIFQADDGFAERASCQRSPVRAMAGSTAEWGHLTLAPGQRWRSTAGGHTITIIQPSIKPARWFVRFDESELIAIIEENELLDEYESALPVELRLGSELLERADSVSR